MPKNTAMATFEELWQDTKQVHEEKHAAFDFRIECPVCHRIIM
jgi:fructose-1,6-bisphosphatase